MVWYHVHYNLKKEKTLINPFCCWPRIWDNYNEKVPMDLFESQSNSCSKLGKWALRHELPYFIRRLCWGCFHTNYQSIWACSLTAPGLFRHVTWNCIDLTTLSLITSEVEVSLVKWSYSHPHYWFLSKCDPPIFCTIMIYFSSVGMFQKGRAFFMFLLIATRVPFRSETFPFG